MVGEGTPQFQHCLTRQTPSEHNAGTFTHNTANYRGKTGTTQSETADSHLKNLVSRAELTL